MNTNLRPISNARATAEFFTGSYRLSATVQTYNRRLVDILGDQMTNFLDLTDVYISRINKPGEIIATYQKGSLIKNEINFILLPSEAQSVSKERFYTHNRARLPIFTTVPSFEVEGQFQWLGDVDIKKILTTDTSKFLAVLNGTATNSFFPQVSFQGPAILVNKAKIEMLCIAENP
jgi:hypothetical protein